MVGWLLPAPCFELLVQPDLGSQAMRHTSFDTSTVFSERNQDAICLLLNNLYLPNSG